MSKKFNLYLGRAGQSAAMSYFLGRGWNVATPEVDVGDDLLVIEDQKGFFTRIQVKTTQSVERETGFRARFTLSIAQLQRRYNPELYYMLMLYRQHEWQHKLLIPRAALLFEYLTHQIGSSSGDNLLLYFSYENGKVMCSGRDFSEFYNNFVDFPIIPH
jgi:hypothetical protein